jgi:hypothetical protein
MRGAIPPLPLYAFVACTGKTSLFYLDVYCNLLLLVSYFLCIHSFPSHSAITSN